MLFLVDDSSSMRLSQDNLHRNFPTFMTTLAGDAAGVCPTSTSPSSRRTWARATARSPAATRRAASRASSSTRPRGTCTASRPRRGRDVHLGHRRPAGTTPATSRTCSPASRRSVRAAAASSTSSPPSCARSAPTGARPPAENQGFLRPDAYLVDHPDHQRGRLLRAARRAAVRHRLEHQHRVAARPARELPLQRVRPPVTTADRPPEPQRAQQRRRRDGHVHQLPLERRGRLPARRRRHRQPDQGAQGRSEPGHRRGDHRVRRRPTPSTGRRRARRTRRAARRPARGR